MNIQNKYDNYDIIVGEITTFLKCLYQLLKSCQGIL